jgi:hypothetical protein
MAGERLTKALREYRKRYHAAGRQERSKLLDEFCRLTDYHRKYAIVLLLRPVEEGTPKSTPRRGPTYSAAAVRVLEGIWKAADYPWSVRLKALLALWLPWARKHLGGCTREVEAQLLRMSARQMDRRLAQKKRKLKRRIYGRTKPGSLLKHHIPIKTDNWDVNEAGFCEIDLVSHSGPCASGDFLHSLNVTDIHTGWCETRAIKGKGEAGVVIALDDIRKSLPFRLKAIDSDNGSEFINYHLCRYCEKHDIQFTRGRPYKKNDNAHIEQKNWTHVRRVLGWDRYDTREELDAMNALYRGELRVMMNLFQPCVKLVRKERVGTKVRRYYDEAKTPIDRLLDARPTTPALTKLLGQRNTTDPFTLSQRIEEQLKRLEVKRRHHKKAAA